MGKNEEDHIKKNYKGRVKQDYWERGRNIAKEIDSDI